MHLWLDYLNNPELKNLSNPGRTNRIVIKNTGFSLHPIARLLFFKIIPAKISLSKTDPAVTWPFVQLMKIPLFSGIPVNFKLHYIHGCNHIWLVCICG